MGVLEKIKSFWVALRAEHRAEHCMGENSSLIPQFIVSNFVYLKGDWTRCEHCKKDPVDTEPSA